jgi:hypothetical protein
MKERSSPRRSRALPPLRSERLLDQVRERVRYLHYSIRIEQAYAHWVRAFVRFHALRHPAELGTTQVEAFLTWLAAERRVAVAVLGLELPWLAGVREPDLLRYTVFPVPCFRATPSSTARATSAS